MTRNIILSLVVCLPMLVEAADLPTVVNQNRANNQIMCIDRAASDCVNTVCLNSPDRNCTDNCKTAAENKCKEMSAE